MTVPSAGRRGEPGEDRVCGERLVTDDEGSLAVTTDFNVGVRKDEDARGGNVMGAGAVPLSP